MKHLISFLVIFLCLSLGVYGQSVFINEIHYDNDGADTNEGVEIAGPAGTNLNGWQIVPYNGNNGAQYSPYSIGDMTIPDQQNGFGTLWFAITGLQNGAPDGIALVNSSNTVIQFLSYEGTFTATDGPANGMESIDIGVSEAGTTPVGESLQLTGNGLVYSDFTWTGPVVNTMGAVNTGQIFQIVTNTVVNFSSSSQTVNEGDGSNQISLSITNPDNNTATTADVVLISGDAIDIDNYATQTVTFPAGSSSNQMVTITITDDSEAEPDETFTFELQNVQGGNSAQAGSMNQFNLIIEDNDFLALPDIVINEIMQNPSAVADNDGEYFELYNAGDVTVDINGWTIADNGSDSHLIDNGGPLTIAPGGYLVLGANDTIALNGGVNVDYMYSSYFLSNSDDEIILIYSDGFSEVDRVEYDGGTNFPDPIGISMELNNPANDNNDGSNWFEATTQYGDGDYGTPGSINSAFVSVIVLITNKSHLTEFRLHPNFPNPFNPSTTLQFDVPKFTDQIELSVYNITGQKVKTLYSGSVKQGRFEYAWDGANDLNQALPSGVYFAVLKTAGFSQNIKMMLIK